MKSGLQQLILICALQLVCKTVFSQVIEPSREPDTVKYIPAIEEQEPIYDVVDEPAEFPGGFTALQKYQAENLNYPQVALENGLQGRCYLQFIVTNKGVITNIEVKRGVPDCPECNKEAIRMVKSMPQWMPGKINGKPVRSRFILPVTFKLN
ncbi:energy transducer TonB [Fluviicola chungangensis]|uniref:Energy transducer TonB n=1 Tax=Fluviicola chungangensis TaxID=2597671 RepID=A0A556N378_9FLAO|nr:energy transducer TonB [Fluviicola chungangensis]TSJ46657.1 energy transducer TonB [Fluviicola chungangensis]